MARLQLLASLVPIWGVAAPGGKGDGIPLEGLMKFVAPTFGNANADVRSAAVNLAVLVGPGMTRNDVQAFPERVLHFDAVHAMPSWEAGCMKSQ